MTEHELRTEPVKWKRRLTLSVAMTMAVGTVGAAWGTESTAFEEPAAIPVAAERAAAAVGPIAPPVVKVEAPPVIVASPVMVPDPRGGDLRTDASADVLPLDYTPVVAARTLLDVAYGDDPEQRLDLYLPDEDDAPVVLYLHSGGWVEGDKSAVPDFVMRFVERGYAVASVGYRLAPEHRFPAPVHDVKRAIRWLKAYSAVDRAVDGDRVVLLGASAGGHLAALAAATPGLLEPEDLGPDLAAFDSTVVGVVSVVGPADLVTFYRHDHAWARPLTEAFLGCAPCRPGDLIAASPVNFLHPDLPPAYFAYGMDDPLIDVGTQAVVLAEAWAAAAGADSTWLDLVEGHGHNLDESLINLRALDVFVDRVSSCSAEAQLKHCEAR